MQRPRPAASLRAVTAVTVAVAALAAGCAGADGSDSGGGAEGVHVVATTSILGDVTRNVVGDAGAVTVLMRAGTDPHSYEPAASDAQALREADLVVANGLGLEESLRDVLGSVESEGVEVLRVADDLDPLAFGATAGHAHDDEDPHEGEDASGDGNENGTAEGASPDPHFWLDPVRVADAVSHLGQRLKRVAPDRAATFDANARTYREEVLAMHEDVAATLASVPDERRTLVTNHDALGYLAARYGFTVVGTVLPGGSTLGEASGQSIADLAALIEEAGIPAIFVETIAPERLAEAVSAEVDGVDVEVVSLYTGSLGAEGSDAATYLAMMRENARRIATSLTAGSVP